MMLQWTASDVSRFMAFVHPEPNSGCWIYAGAGPHDGYGNFTYGGRSGVTVGAHRFMWLATFGEIPPGANVLHRCDMPFCVNPDHLFLGTQTDNMVDMVAKGRHRLTGRPLINSLKVMCKHGHPFIGSNLSIRADGARLCKVCRARIARNNRSKRRGHAA